MLLARSCCCRECLVCCLLIRDSCLLSLSHSPKNGLDVFFANHRATFECITRFYLSTKAFGLSRLRTYGGGLCLGEKMPRDVALIRLCSFGWMPDSTARDCWVGSSFFMGVGNSFMES